MTPAPAGQKVERTCHIAQVLHLTALTRKKGAHRRDSLELMMESRDAHVVGCSQLLNGKGTSTMFSDPGDGFANTVSLLLFEWAAEAKGVEIDETRAQSG